MSNSSPDSSKQPARRPTLKDVAREAGYHVTTISLALRGQPGIPEKTREEIRAIAGRLGYEPNPVFHALSRFRKQGRVRGPAPRIAYLENFGAGSGFTRSPHLELILEGARRQAVLLGYEHSLVRPDDLSRVNAAFFTVNGWIGVTYFAITALARFAAVAPRL